MKGSSLEIAVLAEKFTYHQNQIRTRIEALKKESQGRNATYKAAAKLGEKQIERKEQELIKLRADNEETQKARRKIQCEIAGIRKNLTETTYAFLQAEIATDVEISKLNLLSAWNRRTSDSNRGWPAGPFRIVPLSWSWHLLEFWACG